MKNRIRWRLVASIAIGATFALMAAFAARAGVAAIMTNPTNIGSNWAMVSASTTEGSVTLDRTLAYSVAHDGVDNTGAPSSVVIYLSKSPNVDATPGEGTGRLPLLPNRTLEIRDVSTLYFETQTGAARFTLLPAPGVR